MKKPPVTIAWARFTSCSGCQLMLVNCETSLAKLAELIILDEFPLVSSSCSQGEIIDIGLAEGSLTTPDEIERLLNLRRRSRLLVAVGACALSGGVNTLVKEQRNSSLAELYGQQSNAWSSFSPKSLDHFVKVDWQIPGCPPERHDLLQALGALFHGGCPGHQVMPVCMECRINENRCLLEERDSPCLGPVTFAGCNAKCPGLGVPCEGCRGLVPEANLDEMCQLLLASGLSEHEIRHRLERFGEGLYDPPGC